MKNKMLSRLKKSREDLIVLKHTTLITPDHTRMPEWDQLKQAYDDESIVSVEKLAISVVNAVLTQRRVVFCLTRRAGEDLVRGDKNWTTTGFDNNKWAQMLKILHMTDVIKSVRKGSGRCPGIYEIICPELLSVLIADKTTQMAESIEFADKFKKTDHKTDQVPSAKLKEEKKNPLLSSLPTLTYAITRETLLRRGISLDEKTHELRQYEIPDWLTFCDWCYATIETESAQHVIHRLAPK